MTFDRQILVIKHGPKQKTVLERLIDWSYPEPNTGCWLWGGGLHNKKDGYGAVKNHKGKMEGAHRVSYREFKGPIKKGLLVCHTCDVPLCINPDHLFLGTIQDNMDDKTLKGRNHTKHSDEVIIDIITSELSIDDLELKYPNIHRNYIYEIRRGDKRKKLYKEYFTDKTLLRKK